MIAKGKCMYCGQQFYIEIDLNKCGPCYLSSIHIFRKKKKTFWTECKKISWVVIIYFPLCFGIGNYFGSSIQLAFAFGIIANPIIFYLSHKLNELF